MSGLQKFDNKILLAIIAAIGAESRLSKTQHVETPCAGPTSTLSREQLEELQRAPRAYKRRLIKQLKGKSYVEKRP